MNRSFIFLFALAFLGFFPIGVRAGGSGLDVVIVVNQSSSNSVQLGNYFREQRHVPPQNFLRINWPGTNTEWTLTDYTNTLLNPLLAMLSSRQLTNQIDYVVLSMDIPYRVNGAPNGANSTTSTLFYGFMPDSRDLGTCPVAPGSTNLYAGSESPFRSTPPISSASNSFLVTMITDISLAFAKQIVDQGVRSDGVFPTQTVILAKSTDSTRNFRYLAFDNAVFNTRLRGNYSAVRTNAFSPGQFSNLLGYQNGDYSFGVPTNTFVPGAMADNMTSFGGMLFEDTTGQTVLLALTEAGACGSFGTIDEPCNYPQKFPDPQNYFFQARGFSLAECYYQSVTNPYQGLVVGEPLAAPFAQPGAGAWVGLASNTILAATTNLSLQFSASDAQHPLRQVDLFVDGLWQQTLTNIPPAQGNVLHVTLNGHAASYTVPASATLASVASGLNGVLNGASYANLAKVEAFLHGDRIELQSTDTSHLGSQIPVSASSTNSSGSLTTFISASSTNYLDSIAWGLQFYQLSGTVDSNTFIRVAVTETNGSVVNLALTNTANADMPTFAQSFLDLINTNASPSLQDSNGLAGEDLQFGTSPFPFVQFHLRARNTGYAAAQIQAALTSSLTVGPTGARPLTYNFNDLQPRNHLYITAGTTNLSFAFPFNTTPLADGYHELAAVAYEGSHVRTQTRATQSIRIQNTSLSATFSILVGDTNTALEATMQFAVTANTNTISKIELFSTGGSLGVVTNQSSATFSVPATNLDLGLHPFYAIVTANNGKQYRTETRCIRLIGMDSPFSIQISTPPIVLVWPATAGRSYDILGATNATDTFQVRDSITPTNSLGQWTETNLASAQLFYQVRVTP